MCTAMAHFEIPQIVENDDGWGPSELPDTFKDMPYQPFSKGDRLGKVADWSGNVYQDRKYQNKYSSQFGQGLGQYSYYHEEDESTFQLVDSSKVQRPGYMRKGRFPMQQRLRKEREKRQQQLLQQAKMEVLSKSQKNRERDRQRQLKKWQKQFGRQMQEKKPQIKNRDSSVNVRDDWKVLEELDFVRLQKLSLPTVAEPVDLRLCGAVEYYDKAYDRVSCKNEKKLQRINRVFHKVTTTDDPVIRQLAKTQGNVFATDAVLASIMCCTRSVYSWDVVVQKVRNKLFFDKRDDSDFDLLTVCETATEPPQDEEPSINSPRNLGLEATFINHNFSQQVLKVGEEKHSFENPNPFAHGEEDVASVAYRYRKYELGNDVELIVRCEHDAAMQGPGGETQFVNIKTLNEWDPRFSGGVDWRSKLDLQRGAVLATELKNNSYKLAKWTTSALLAGSDQIKFGYVSRVKHNDTSRHVVLGTSQFKPTEFANQINLNMDNAWGILRCVIDLCKGLGDGKYLLLKDPNKSVVRIYDIPDDTFESSDEEGEESDSSSEEESSEEEEEDAVADE